MRFHTALCARNSNHTTAKIKLGHWGQYSRPNKNRKMRTKGPARDEPATGNGKQLGALRQAPVTVSPLLSALE